MPIWNVTPLGTQLHRQHIALSPLSLITITVLAIGWTDNHITTNESISTLCSCIANLYCSYMYDLMKGRLYLSKGVKHAKSGNAIPGLAPRIVA